VRQQLFLAARIDRWAQERPLLLDSIVAGATWLVFGLVSVTFAGLPGLVIATATIAALAVRRRFPAAVLAWSAVLFAVQLVTLPMPLPANIAQAIVIYTVAAHVTSLPVRLLTLGAAGAGCLLGGFRWNTPPEYLRNSLVTGLFLAFFAALIWVIGNLVRGRAANMLALREAYARLEDGRRERERFVAQRERISAAGEIHDIVAHSLTVVIVQADGAEYAAEHAVPWDRADARAVLATIGRTARTALAEVRGVVAMLRDPEPPDGSPGARAGSAELWQLIGSVRAAGLSVDVEADPAVFDEVSAPAALAVVRVVRESLTNVLKHAGPHATARVTVARAPGAVRVCVADDGAGRSQTEPGGASTTGHGLDGMRDRLHALNGTLVAGSRPGRGFIVEAAIPVAAPAVPSRGIDRGAER
jgi:signal transduction histidine kinase